MAALQPECDFACDLALLYPLRVINAIMGLPEEVDPTFLKLTQQLFGAADEDVSNANEGLLERMARIYGEFQGIFGPVIEDRRNNPIDDLASVLANAEIDGERLPETEIMGYFLIVATAGHDTTSATTAGGLLALIENPEELAKLKANPDLIPNAVEEFFRWVAPVKNFVRTASRDVELGGQTIRADELSIRGIKKDKAATQMSDLIVSLEDGVFKMAINRPQAHNAMTSELIADMQAAAQDAAENQDVRCVVLTSVGGAFCIGADANQIPVDDDAEVPSRAARIKDLRDAADLSLLLYTMPRPTIAVMPGAAAGGGLSLALACDMRFCLDTATLSTAFSMIGGSGDFGVSYFLPRLIGTAKARDLLFTSRRITGAQALDIGLVNAVAGADTFEADAEAFVREIASLPTVAIGHIKQNLIAAQSESIHDVLDLEAKNMVLSMETEDHKIAVKALTNQLANALVERGVGRNDVVGVHMPNIPQYAIVLLAASKIGASLTGISGILSKPEFVRQIADANVKALFAFEALAGMMLTPDDVLPTCVDLVVVAGAADYLAPQPVKLPQLKTASCHAFLDFIAGASTEYKAIPLPPDHIALIQYTGGTTGPSKGALLTLRGTMHNAALSQVHRPWQDGEETVASALPMFHVGGMIITIMSLRYGARFLLFPDPRDMDHVCAQMIKHPPTRTGAVPTLYQMIADHPASKDIDFSKMRFAQTGAAPITGASRERIEHMLRGTVLSDSFGMTETGPAIICNPPARCNPEALGLPLPGIDVRIVDVETGTQEMPYGEPGEIIAASPCLMAGYLNQPDETANALRQWRGKTWMHTGDIGVMDESGYVYIRDRKKDMIIVSGFKVFSTEVENEVAEIDAIAMSALIGQPDESRPGSEIVNLFVELTEEAKTRDEAAIREEILDFCRERLARYKVPKRIHFIDAIPLTPVGKVDKKVLRARV
eukprot:g3384.t1